MEELEMNIELLNKIVSYAEAEPRRFDMETWYTDVSSVLRGDRDFDDSKDDNQFVADSEADLPPCGTMGCMAGLACILSGKAEVYSTERIGNMVVNHYEVPTGGWFDAAKAVLGISGEQAERLFYPSAVFVEKLRSQPQHWPEPFSTEYEAHKHDAAKRVEILKARVEHFIATDGAE